MPQFYALDVLQGGGHAVAYRPKGKRPPVAAELFSIQDLRDRIREAFNLVPPRWSPTGQRVQVPPGAESAE